MNYKLIAAGVVALIAAHDIGVYRARRRALPVLNEMADQIDRLKLKNGVLLDYAVETIVDPANVKAATKLEQSSKFVNIVTH